MLSKQRMGALALLFSLSLMADSFQRQELTLTNVTSSNGHVIPSQPLAKGESGFIVRNFGPNEMIIIAKVIVSDANATDATLTFRPYNATTQSALPSLQTSPQNGDKVVIHPFGKRAMILAPHFDAYQKTSAMLNAGDVVHPDHFATSLLSHYNPTPKKEDIQTFCENYAVEFVYVTFSSGLVQMRDCGSLALLNTTSIQPSTRGVTTDETLPFYHRVSPIKRGLFDFGPQSIGKFDTYYTKIFEGTK